MTLPERSPDRLSAALRAYTSARVGIGRAGGSVPTREHLAFQLAHARARDAVHAALDAEALAGEIANLQGGSAITRLLVLRSAATDRACFLLRPDLGRRLDTESRERLTAWRDSAPARTAPDLSIVVSDGLSATAVHRQVGPLLGELLPRLSDWTLAPVVIVQHGRVAIQDEIGELLDARLSLILIGERPGMGSPDSLGAYMVYEPRPGRTDAERNCVSNIRPEGLAPAVAARVLHAVLTAARRHALSGVGLKVDPRALTDDA